MVRRLLLLNGLAVVGAVLNHTTGWGFTAMFWWVHRYLPVEPPNFDQMGSAGYYLLLGLQQAIMFAVPAFLFVSGYFIAFATGRQDLKGSWRLIRSRIIYLLVPYLVWSLLVFAADFVEGKRQTVAGYARCWSWEDDAGVLLHSYDQLIASPLPVRAAKRYPGIAAGTLIEQLGANAGISGYVGLIGVAALLTELMSRFFPGHLSGSRPALSSG